MVKIKVAVLAIAMSLGACRATRIVVVVQTPRHFAEYSTLSKTLEDLRHEVTFRYLEHHTVSDQAEAIIDGGHFDSLLLLTPSAKALPSDLSPQRLLAHVNAGRNLLLSLSSDTSELWRDFAREFDLEFEERGSTVVDHFHYDTALDDGLHTTLVLPVASLTSPFISEKTRGGPPILYKGIGHEHGRLPLILPILTAATTSYSSDLSTAEAGATDVLSGRSIGLISGIQAKNNARVTFVGSLDLLADTYATAAVHCSDGSSFDKSGNTDLIEDILKWTFQQSGVVRATNLQHSRVSDGSIQTLYRVREELEVSLDLSQADNGVWQPFAPNDLQFELIMMDPHLRLPMKVTSRNSNSTTMAARFRTPDRHGVFTMRVDYRRPGWSYLDEKVVVSVTPPRHDEYERFIAGAVPYYTGAFSVSIATLVFVFVWSLQ